MPVAEITKIAISPGFLIDSVQSTEHGALVTFVGLVRASSRRKRVCSLEYTAYDRLALSELGRIAREAEARCGGLCAISHRLGEVPIGEASVYIAVSAPHRADAFEACRWTIDEIKTRVPIWKRESYDDGDAWIEGERTFPAESPK